MSNLKYELEKQLLYCHIMDNFRAAVYVSSKDKISCVKNILDDIFDNLFPIKNIAENTKVPRKILERHRKYIIAAVEIICNDFPLLQEYIK